MTRLEALTIFQLPANATEAQIETAYQDRFNNLQQQLRNSPSEFLKNKFQNNLNEWDEAYHALKTVPVAHLPSAKPIAVQDIGAAAARPLGGLVDSETL